MCVCVPVKQSGSLSCYAICSCLKWIDTTSYLIGCKKIQTQQQCERVCVFLLYEIQPHSICIYNIYILQWIYLQLPGSSVTLLDFLRWRNWYKISSVFTIIISLVFVVVLFYIILLLLFFLFFLLLMMIGKKITN